MGLCPCVSQLFDLSAGLRHSTDKHNLNFEWFYVLYRFTVNNSLLCFQYRSGIIRSAGTAWRM